MADEIRQRRLLVNRGVMGYTQTGGARVGRNFWWSINWTTPYATLEFDEQVLRLSIPRRTYRLARDEIARISMVGPKGAPPGFHGILVAHSAAKVPRYVLFWSFDRPALIEALKESGYSLS